MVSGHRKNTKMRLIWSKGRNRRVVVLTAFVSPIIVLKFLVDYILLGCTIQMRGLLMLD